ncbi:hypothetical protein FACS1894180_4440 [Bacteroidia bacterium]|nr:hypothetical protein FACS1894180_4440 [Bacteroidia bacterium]
MHFICSSNKLVCFFIAQSFVFANLQAQNAAKPDCFIEGGLRYGYALHHPSDYTYLKNLYFNSYEVRFGLQTSGERAWEHLAGKPILGVALRFTDYTDFGDSPEQQKLQREIMGKNIALFGYIQAPIVRWKFFTWHYQIGMGAAYFTKIFDEKYAGDDNRENGLVSMRVNPYINLQSGFDFKLNDKFDIALNANFMHSSNASLNFPNWGINEIQGIASLRYHLNAKDLPARNSIASDI